MKKLLCLVLVSLAFGCGAVCPIINMANEACPVVVEYLGEDGKTHQVSIPAEHVNAAVAAATKQGVSPWELVPKDVVLATEVPCAPVKP